MKCAALAILAVLAVLACISPECADEQCTLDKAIRTQDARLCPETGALSDSCYAAIAEETYDVSLCPLISGAETKDGCYKHVAEVRRDPLVCENIADHGVQITCEAQISKNQFLCRNIQDEMQLAKCFAEVAEAKPDATLCRDVKVSEEYARAADEDVLLQIAEIKDECYLNVALSTNSDPCAQIADDAVKSMCYRRTQSLI